jgi:hypothetical protein
MGPWTGGPGPQQNSKMISTIELVTKGYAPSNLGRASKIGWRRAAVLGLHGGAMAERGGSSEWRLVCTMAYSFRRFWAQIKVGVEGSSPRGIPNNGGHRKMACGSKGSALALSNDGRELQGAVSAGSSPNGCSTASTSSSGSHHGPKHSREAALCVGVVSRV